MTQNHGDTETAAREAYRAEVQRVNRSRDHEINEALRPASPGEVTVTEAIQKHPDYERVRKIWDDALKISEGHCRDLDEKLERETGRVVEYSNRISVLLSEKADLTAALSARPTAPDAVAVTEAMVEAGARTRCENPDGIIQRWLENGVEHVRRKWQLYEAETRTTLTAALAAGP